MKRLFPLLLCCLAFPASGQTLEEWFQQKKTQKEYLVRQIAALQAYAGTLRQGYDVLSEGISTVQDIRNGDLGLHRVFFHSLRQVAPALGQSPKLAELLAWQMAISRDLDALRREETLSSVARDYVEQVRTQLLLANAQDLETLWLLFTADALSLDTAARLQGLDSLHGTMRARYQFTRQFSGNVRSAALWKHLEKENLRTLSSFYGLPNLQNP